MRLWFEGHACFGLDIPDVGRLCVDPYPPGVLCQRGTLHALSDTYDYAVATHDHSDHSAFHAVPSATALHAPSGQRGALCWTTHQVAHDEFGGRLRGGLTRMLSLRFHGVTVVHCGDIGERPCGDALQWLWQQAPDLLLVPTGGYYTLGADGAAELAHLVRPGVVVACHAADQGLPDPNMAPSSAFYERFTHAMDSDAMQLESSASAKLPEGAATRAVRLRPQRLSR